MVIRCLFNKQWPSLNPKVTQPVGKFSVEKVESLAVPWAKAVDHKHPYLNFAEDSGLKEQALESKEDLKEIDLKGLREVQKADCEAQVPEGPKCSFSRGDEVTVVRRMSWPLPQPDAPHYKRDIAEGSSGTIEGWADLEQRQVLLKVILDLPSGPKQSITNSVFPRNLKLTSEYLKEKAASSDTGPKEDTKAGCPSWALESSNATDVKVEPTFRSLVADCDKNAKLMHLKARIGMSLEALTEALPMFTDKDLVVVHRRSEKGLWKDEVWTNGAFQRLELQLGPFSSQLKDTHLMVSGHAVVGLPKHGRGAHPDHQSLALDGRGKNQMAAKGSLDEEEHQGSLFWMVTRTSKASEANLTMEDITFEHQVSVNLPGPKRRKITRVHWETADLPTIPILVNNRDLKKHTKLQVFQAERSKKQPGIGGRETHKFVERSHKKQPELPVSVPDPPPDKESSPGIDID